MWLVVGLGNPGSEYARTRHNVGFMVVDELGDRGRAGTAKAKLGAELREGTVGGERALLCKPMEFMNVSGAAVGRVAGFWKIPLEKLIVVHDELDLPFARMKLAAGGGAGGHNGIRSLISTMGADFARVRIGIGKPPAGRPGADHVLTTFSSVEQKELPFVLGEAADAVETIVRQGLTAAMNKFNAKKKENTGAS